jgi:hypothetical protein
VAASGTPSATRAAERVKRRRIAVWTLIVVGAVILFVGSFTVWTKQQLLDTDTWTASSTELLDDPDIRQQLSVYMVEQLYTGADVQAQVEAKLPDNLQALAGPISGALYEAAVRTANALLEAPRVQQLWEEVNRRAHAQLVDVLKGREGKRVTTEHGEAVLDLSPLIERLEDRFGIQAQLDEDAGKIVLLKSDQLEAAQKAVRAVDVLSAFVGLLALLFFAVAVYLAAGWRRIAIRGAALSVLIAAALLLVLRRVGGDAVVNALVDNHNVRPSALTAWYVETSEIRDLGRFLFGLAVIGLVGVWLAGPSGSGTAVRRELAGPFRDHVALVYAAYVLVVAGVFMVAPISPARAFGLLALAILGAIGLEVLRRQALREFPEPLPSMRERWSSRRAARGGAA